jgi:sugar phosphate isomerase/epimerase
VKEHPLRYDSPVSMSDPTGTAPVTAVPGQARYRCRGEMKLAIVLSTHATRFTDVAFSGDFETNVASVARMGYDGVELAIRDPGLVDAGELKAVVERYGLVVPAIGTGQAWVEERLSFTDPDPVVRRAAIERIESHIALAGRFDALVMIGLIRGKIAPGAGKEQAMDWLVEALRACAAAGARQGVRLVLEPIHRYEADLIHSAQDGLDLLDRVACDNVGLILDTFHMNIEDPSIEGSLRMAGNRLFHVHVADSNRRYPGAGHIDFAGVIRTLREIGFRGFVSSEFMPIPDPLTAAQRAMDTLRPLLREK